ncbi:MAG: hypothetical protein WCV68_01280 [Candidatus Paceibacterota bacterium]|jgi:hypothetical protein
MSEDSPKINSDNEGILLEEKKWHDFFKKFNDLRNTVLAKIFDIEDQEKQDYFWQKIDKQREKIFATYEDRSKYLAFHIEVSGGTDYKSSPKLDFEGENSLFVFYEELLKELNNS